MPLIKIKPNPEKQINGQLLKVMDPVTKDFLPKEGRVVVQNAYWTRRLIAGEVILLEEDKNVSPKPNKKTNKGGK